MATKKEFMHEFWMFFWPKNDQQKIAKYSNQMYLWTSEKVQSPLQMNWNAFLVQEEGYMQRGRE